MIVMGVFLQFTVFGQNKPFQIPKNGNKVEVYRNIDFYHFSTVAFDSQNRPYGFNIKEEFGYVRTLRNDQWVKRNYIDDLKNVYPDKKLSNPHVGNTHAQCRVSITSDDHLYVTLNYNVDGKTCWAILYLDDLDTEDFQVYVMPNATSLTIEEHTSYNLMNGETPAIVVSSAGKSLAEMGWPTPKVSWTIGGVSVLHVMLPYRNQDGTLSFNKALLGEKLGAITIHSGGCATLATKGNKTYLCYNAFDEEKIVQEKSRERVNKGMLAEIIRPKKVKGKIKIKTRFMAIQSVYGHIDSHSQGGVVIDKEGKLHYFSGNHAANDEYFRSTHSIDNRKFGLTGQDEWEQHGMTTRKGDFSYDTPVIDGHNQIHFAYRQRNGGAGRGLCVKSASTDVTNWNVDLGELVVQPPSPYDKNGAYIILYHRLVLDRCQNIHLSSGFFEFESGVKGEYPRIGAIKKNGSNKWILADRKAYIENIIKKNR